MAKIQTTIINPDLRAWYAKKRKESKTELQKQRIIHKVATKILTSNQYLNYQQAEAKALAWYTSKEQKNGGLVRSGPSRVKGKA